MGGGDEGGKGEREEAEGGEDKQTTKMKAAFSQAASYRAMGFDVSMAICRLNLDASGDGMG